MCCLGIGLGLMYVPAVVAVGQYFTRRPNLATGEATPDCVQCQQNVSRCLCLWLGSRNISLRTHRLWSGGEVWMARI